MFEFTKDIAEIFEYAKQEPERSVWVKDVFEIVEFRKDASLMCA